MVLLILKCYITLAIALTAVGSFAGAWVNLKRGSKTWHWIRIKGEVISVSVDESGTTTEFDHPTYQVHAKVKYEVDGKTYQTSHANDFVGSISSIGKPIAPRKKSVIPVYCNPENPNEAVIKRVALHFAIILGLLGFGFTALGWIWVGKSFF